VTGLGGRVLLLVFYIVYAMGFFAGAIYAAGRVITRLPMVGQTALGGAFATAEPFLLASVAITVAIWVLTRVIR
jgi:hypothetical protein